MVSGDVALSGAPDVILFNALLGRLYVAIGTRAWSTSWTSI